MKSFTVFSAVFGLAITCQATLSFDNAYSLHRRAQNSSESNTTCATGVHIIVARASTEAPGEGIIGTVATKVQQSIPGSNSEAVDYPATLTNYSISEASGVAAMQNLIQNYVTRCPSSKIALMGYSQGAQVVGDVLCGTDETAFDGVIFNSTAPLSPALSKNIVAVIQMGDPSHVPNLPQDVGNSTQSGIFPRLNTAACSSYAPIIQSYCNANDMYCDSGNSLLVHISYVQAFGSQAAQFVIDKVMAKTNGTTGTSETTSATGTANTSVSANRGSTSSGASITFRAVAVILSIAFVM